MSSPTKKIHKGMVTMNPFNITSWLLLWIRRKDCSDREWERKQTETLTVAAAWQLMSSQFNHRIGSWGS